MSIFRNILFPVDFSDRCAYSTLRRRDLRVNSMEESRSFMRLVITRVSTRRMHHLQTHGSRGCTRMPQHRLQSFGTPSLDRFCAGTAY